MKDLVDEGISIIRGNSDITAFGELLDEAWQLKRGLSKKVSNSDVDRIFAAAKSAGAIGGKITGAGGGGSVWALGDVENIKALKNSWEALFVSVKGAKILDCAVDPIGVR